jgi:hypothetical protein
VNAALFLMSVVAGADTQAPPPPPPPAHHHPAPAPIVAPGHPAPCGGCGAPCGDPCADNCRGRDGLLVRLKARFARNKHDCGCDAPVYTGFTTACCDPCERHGWGSGPGLFSRLRGKFKKGGDCCDPCDPCGATGQWTAGYPGCALPPFPGTATPPPPPTAPKDMPKPKKDPGPEAGLLNHPTVVPTVTVPTIPSIPTSSPRNPF